MAQSIRKWLVIDASVGGMTGSGTVAEDTPHGRCRRCLRTVRDNHYGIFFHPQTWEEWRRHRSQYAKEWLQQMYSRKGVTIKREDEIPESLLTVRLQRLTGKKVGMEILSEAVCAIMLKDCHLLEASLAADNIIVSLDVGVTQLESKSASARHRNYSQFGFNCVTPKMIKFASTSQRRLRALAKSAGLFGSTLIKRTKK